jgi:hypothetical protein
MAVLTDEQQALVGPMSRAGMSTLGTRLAAVVGIDLDRHRLMQQGFIGNHALQLGKAPLGMGSIGLSLLLARRIPLLAFGSLTNIPQVFQPDQAVWVLLGNALGDDMIGVLRSPVSPVR